LPSRCPAHARAFIQARERERGASLTSALEAGLEARGAAVIQLDRFGRIAHVSGSGRELIHAYFGTSHSNGRGPLLPPAVSQWVQGELAREPLTVEGPRGRLRIRTVGGSRQWRELLLEERRSSPPSVEALTALGLSRREAQVLRLVVSGKRNQQIAHELLISEGTVRKHLEHIYSRLGVASRAQAIAHVNA
jgi:ATP/maltotriose-dependent transcriptional regulator MalT